MLRDARAVTVDCKSIRSEYGTSEKVFDCLIRGKELYLALPKPTQES